MNRGYCIVAQNNVDTDYVRSAYALAVSLIKHNPTAKVSLITDDEVEKSYQHVFDQIIPIPWGDMACSSSWKIENRWKVYHVSPYESTIVFDADMLVMTNIQHWWWELEKQDLFFVSNVKNYRGETITSRFYRKTFDANNLPNLYSGIYFFKKSDKCKEFFYLVEQITKNWEVFYEKYAPKIQQNWSSYDVSCAIASKILGNEKEITNPNSIVSFVHMKRHIQGWHTIPSSWLSILGKYITNDRRLFLGNYAQDLPVHYVEKNFLTDELLARLEDV